MKIGFRTRIYPNEEQIKWLKYYCRASHEMWNLVVAKFRDSGEQVKCFANGIGNMTAKQLLDEYGKEHIHNRICVEVLTRYSKAWKRVYTKTGKTPKFHKYNPNKQSFCITSQTVKISEKNTIMLPISRGIKFKGRQMPIDMKFLNKYGIRTITEPRFTCKYGKWYVSGSCEVEVQHLEETESQLGLDWGIKNFMTTSEGNFINYPKSVLRQFCRINSLKSKLSKKVKGSNNYFRLLKKLDLAWQRFENLKNDFIEKTTTKLAKENNIAVENLTNNKIKESNKNFRRRKLIAPLNRFVEKLEWKCNKFGRDFIKVNPAYTSMDCSKCGKRNFDLKLKDRIYDCSCGNKMDRDVNAACNIVARGYC